MPTLGIEMEMPVIDCNTGELHLVDRYFDTLAAIKRARGEDLYIEKQGGRPISVVTEGIVSSIDNAFNNLESAIGPVPENGDNLTELNRIIQRELGDVSSALLQEEACILNFSQHPNTRIDPTYYRRACSPKPIYDYWNHYRNWNHMAGIDAKAHNGPTTGTSVFHAIDGLNILLGLSSVFIALFANSPFVAGAPNGIKENRQSLWEEMLSPSRFSCDKKFIRLPHKPFTDLRHYFEWMFGKGTNMQPIVDRNGGSYKQPKQLLAVIGDPSVLEFIQGKRWPVEIVGGEAKKKRYHQEIVPEMAHFEFLQFSHFLDTRIRYQFKKELIPMELFVEFFKSDKPLEEFFDSLCSCMYLEGRAAGANFPDEELAAVAAPDVVRSVVVSPSALQVGLLQNREKVLRLVEKVGWQTLVQLRHAAIRDGLHGRYGDTKVEDLCRVGIELAAEALSREHLWMLAYPLHVLDTMKNGADRALAAFDKEGGARTGFQKILQSRRFVPAAESS